MSKLVDFFIVGQPKSGTTALTHFLDQHPDICMTFPKEPAYMASDLRMQSDAFHGGQYFFPVRSEEQYRKAYEHCRPDALVGDASTCYLYSACAASEISKYNPNAKIIIMLRNPVDMIHSLYLQYRNQDAETAGTFAEALDLEEARSRGEGIPPRSPSPRDTLYRRRGLYYEQVKRFYDCFGADRIIVVVSELFRKDNTATYRDVLNFLGVNPDFNAEFKGVNERKKARSVLLLRFVQAPRLKKAIRWLLGEQRYTFVQKRMVEPLLFKRATSESLDDEVRKELERYFEADVDRLARLTGLKLRDYWF